MPAKSRWAFVMDCCDARHVALLPRAALACEILIKILSITKKRTLSERQKTVQAQRVPQVLRINALHMYSYTRIKGLDTL